MRLQKIKTATYFHLVYTDANPQHELCPNDNWCKYKKAFNKSQFFHKHGINLVCFHKTLYDSCSKSQEKKGKY